MSSDGLIQSRQGIWSSLASLFTTTGTLVCCALPAMLVALGAGSVLSSLVAVVPQIVWLSEHKELVFGVALVMLAVGGVLQWRSRNAPCPVDPRLRNACLKTRKVSAVVYALSVGLFCVGAWFAFVLPLLGTTAS